MISLTYIKVFNLCVFSVFVVGSSSSLARPYLRIYFTRQTQESHFSRHYFGLIPGNQRSNASDGRDFPV
nr:hypothetical protein [Microcystis aeruginosa]